MPACKVSALSRSHVPLKDSLCLELKLWSTRTSYWFRLVSLPSPLAVSWPLDRRSQRKPAVFKPSPTVKSFGDGMRLINVVIQPDVSNAGRFTSQGVKTPPTFRPNTLTVDNGPVALAGCTE